jgi:hypothetical protein
MKTSGLQESGLTTHGHSQSRGGPAYRQQLKKFYTNGIQQVLLRDANQGGQGGRLAPLTSRLHSIPTRFSLNLHGV